MTTYLSCLSLFLMLPFGITKPVYISLTDIIEGDIKAGPELIPVTADHLTRGAIVSTKRHSFLWPSETVGNKRIIRIPYELRRGVFDGLCK